MKCLNCKQTKVNCICKAVDDFFADVKDLPRNDEKQEGDKEDVKATTGSDLCFDVYRVW